MRPRATLPPGCDPESILLTFPVSRERAGLRLDRFLQACIPRLSRTRANEIVRQCAYRATGERRRPSDRVRAGETVLIVRPPMDEPSTPQDFQILYEDASILVVDKPAGLPMHPTATYHKNTLAYMLRERYGEPPPEPAHRLDKETSGVVVCSLQRTVERTLKKAFEDRKPKKTYIAIVRGIVEKDDGVIEQPMRPVSEGLHVLMEVHEDGMHAFTTYRVLARCENATLIELKPQTGRQHQLRVHMAYLGHPILGCKLYGPYGFEPFYEYIETGMTPSLLERLGHERHALHAMELIVPHYGQSEQSMKFHAPFPEDLRKLWIKLGGEEKDMRFI